MLTPEQKKGIEERFDKKFFNPAIPSPNDLKKSILTEIERAIKEDRERFKSVFFKHFKGAGELWFPYFEETSEEEKLQPVQEHWDEIEEELINQSK